MGIHNDLILIHNQLEVQSQNNFQIFDITSALQQQVSNSSVTQGQLLVTVQHTTTALTINENEERLLQDIELFYKKLVPPGERYLHNDLHLRVVPPDEPKNAHAHIISMLFNTNETIGIRHGELVLGRYQSILFLELDGPRTRKIYYQILGSNSEE